MRISWMNVLACAVLGLGLGLTGCEKSPTERAKDQIDQQAEDKKEAIEANKDATEDAAAREAAEKKDAAEIRKDAEQDAAAREAEAQKDAADREAEAKKDAVDPASP